MGSVLGLSGQSVGSERVGFDTHAEEPKIVKIKTKTQTGIQVCGRRAGRVSEIANQKLIIKSHTSTRHDRMHTKTATVTVNNSNGIISSGHPLVSV